MTTNTHSTHFSKTIIATLTLLLLTGLSAAATINVDDDGSADNTTIGAAIDYASSGDTISVDSGNYGVVELNVSDLILKGPNSGMHGNSSERVSEATFEISGDIVNNNVTVDGFEVATANFTEIKAKNTEISNSIVKVPDNGAPFRLQDEANGTKITKNKIAGGEGGNFVINARQTFSDLIHNVRITRNEFSDLPGTGKTVIQAAGFVNATISGNIFDNIGEDAIRLAGNVSGTEVKNNEFSDYAQDPGFPVGAIFANDAEGDVNVADNQFANSGGEDIYVSTFNRNDPAALDLDAVRSSNQYDENSFVSGTAIVPDSAINVRNLDQTTGYDTIQAAVDDASSGDTLEVKEGTYNEQVVLDRGDTGQSDLTIEAADSASERPLVWYNGSEGEPTFAVDSEGATIEGLEIKRNNSGDTVAQGVRVAADDVLLEDNVYDVGAGDRAVGIYTDSSGAAGNPTFDSEISSVEVRDGEIISDANPSGDATVGVEIANTTDNSATFADDSVSINDVDFTGSDARVHVWEFDLSDLSEDVGAIDSDAVASGNTFDQLVNVDDPTISAIVSRTIQEAVDKSAEGATVEADSATYEETVDIHVDNLTLEGQGIGDSVINGSINIGQDESSVSVNETEISGFTVNSRDGDFAVETTTEHTENITIEDNRIVGEAGSAAAAYFQDPINIDIKNNKFAGPEGSGVSETVGDLLVVGAGSSDDGKNYSISGNSFESTIERDQSSGGNAIEIRTDGTVEVEDNDFTDVNSSNGALIWASSKSTDVSIHQNEIVHNGGTGDGVTAQDGAGVDAAYNYWGAASGPEGSGADVSSNVDFEPWLLEADGTEYEETVSLTGGDWSLVSAPESVEASNVVVDNGSDAKHFVYDTEASQFNSVDSVDSNPLSATFVYSSDASGVGLNYSDSSSASKDVAKGWNVISSTQDIKLRDALSPVAGSLNSFFAPADYNDEKLGGLYTDLGDRSSEVVDASSLDYLQDQFGSSQKVSRYDGYWVKASGSSTLELSVPQPE